jgi:hypothetical protein
MVLQRYHQAGLKCIIDCRMQMCQQQVCLHIACNHQAIRDGIAEKVKTTTRAIRKEFNYLNWSPFPIFYVGMRGKFHHDIRRDWRHGEKLDLE